MAAANFDPYHKWLGIPPEEQPADHYRLLGIRQFESDADVIQSAADQRMAHVRTFQGGQHSEYSQRLLNELAAARVNLLKHDRKAAYDEELRSKVAAAAPPATRLAAVVSVPTPVFALPVATPLDFTSESSTAELPPARRRHKHRPKSALASAPLWLAVCLALLGLVLAGAWWKTRTDATKVAADTRMVSPDPEVQVDPAEPTETTTPVPDPRETPVASTGDTATSPTTPVSAAPPKPEPPQPTLRRLPACIDDGEAGFSTTGDGWEHGQGERVGYHNTHHFHGPGNSTATARWVFDGLESGKSYDVYASWNEHELHAAKARYVVTGVMGEPRAAEVDQQRQPKADANFNNYPFQKLGTFTSTSGVLTVRIAADPVDHVCADAILLVPAREPKIAAKRDSQPSTSPDAPRGVSPNPFGREVLGEVIVKGTLPILDLALAPDSKFIACTDGHGTLATTVWDLTTQQQLRRLTNSGNALRLVPETGELIVANEGTSIIVTDWARRQQARGTTFQAMMGETRAAATTRDGAFIAVGGGAGAQVWEVQRTPNGSRSIVERVTFRDIQSPVSSLAFIPSEQRLLIGCGGDWQGTKPIDQGARGLINIDAVSGRRDDVNAPGLATAIWAMAFSGEGRRLYTASHDGRLRVWKGITGLLEREWKAHNGAATCMVLMEDAQLVVSGGQDGALRIWNANTGRLVREFAQHDGAIRALAASSDGRIIVSGGVDGTVRLYAFDETPASAGSDSAPGIITKREKTPSPADVATAVALIKDVFKDDYAAAKQSADKIGLAKKLEQQSSDTKVVNERYALLVQARELAQAGGDALLTVDIIRKLAEQFEIDTWPAIVDSFEQIGRTAQLPAVRKSLAEAGLDLAKSAVAENQYAAAKKVLTIALAASKKTSDVQLTREITDRGKAVVEQSKRFAVVQVAKDTLAGAPDDPEANLTYGRYCCFAKDDWQTGLPHLVKGSDAKLAEFAQQELAAPTATEARVKLADGWWECAQSAPDAEKVKLLARAENWYQLALPELKGLAQTKVQKRLDELVAEAKVVADKVNVGDGVSGKAKGTLATQIRAAIKKGSFHRTPVYGNQRLGRPYEEISPTGALLVGFNYSMIQGDDWICELQPVYLAAKGASTGIVYGRNQGGQPQSLIAKKGYAVGGLEARGYIGGNINGFEVIFVKVGKDGLDPKDSYRTTMGKLPAGNANFNGGNQNGITLGDNGRAVIGIFGSVNGSMVQSIGLIQPGD